MSLLVPTLARMTLQSVLRSRRFVVVLLVAAIPLLLGAALIAADASANEGARSPGQRFNGNMAEPLAYLVLGGTIPFVAMLLAGTVVADDVEDRTFSYILVRPLRRHQIYLSRLLPVAAIAAAVALLQVALFAGLRFLSYMLYGQGSIAMQHVDGRWVEVSNASLMATQAGLALVAAPLCALAFVSLFAFVTVLTTRYHFLANVLTFASFELLFGNLGGQGAGILTVTYHARSITMATGDPYGYHPALWWVAILALMAMTAFWTWLGAYRMGRRDFNITSAAS